MYIAEGVFKVRGVQLDKEELDYDSLAGVETLLDKLSSIEPHNSYITDYFQNRVLFMSESFCRLVGYSREEIAALGEGFYRKVFTEDELALHIRIAEAFIDFYYGLSHEDRQHFAATYNFPILRKDGRRIGISRRTTPLRCLPDGRLWLSISCLNYSSSDKVESVSCTVRNRNASYSYSLETGRWTEQKSVTLSERERFTAIEIYRGTCDKRIAEALCVTKDTVSYYKKQIMQKTNTKTIRAALEFLVTHYII